MDRGFIGFKTLSCAGSLFLSLTVGAGQQENLFDLSIEELSDVTINSVALRQQRPQDSAALVTVITRDMLDSYAVGSLAQALNLLPGVQILQRTTFNQPYSSVRSVSVNDNDKHVLILIDGVPVRVNSIGGSNRLLYEAFPVSSIERIELIQGQAATLYGSNAVNAVVNVVTRATNALRAEWRDGASAGGIGQSFQLGGANFDVSLNRQRPFTHWDHTGVVIPPALSGELSSRGDSLLARWRGDTLHGLILLMDGKSTTISTLYAATPNSELNDKTVLARFGAEQPVAALGDAVFKWDVALDSTEIRYVTNNGDSQEFRLNAALLGNLHDKLHWVFGTALMQADGILNPLLPDWSVREHSAYAQLSYDLTDALEIGSGLNWQQLKDADHDLTPQASLVWKANEQWRVKMLYGESFRNADPRERFSMSRTQQGNPNLTAERGEQSTVALSYNRDTVQLQVAWFEQQLSDVISLVRQPDQSRSFQNIGRAESQGLQFELHWQLAKHWRLDGTHTQVFSAEGVSEPRQLSSIGWRYQGASPWSASLKVDYASAGRYVVPLATPAANPEPESGFSWHAVTSFQLDHLCSFCLPGAQLQLSAMNLGNAQRWQVGTVTINTIPGLPERSWALSVHLPLML